MPFSFKSLFRFSIILLSLVAITTSKLKAQLSTTDFVTSWKTTNPGISGDSSVQIPTDFNFGYNYDVDWDNDGIFDTTGITSDFAYTFPDTGTYIIRIKGLFPSIKFGNNQKIVSIDQWGNQNWRSLQLAFVDCNNLSYNATDIPDLNNISDLSFMFPYTNIGNANLNNWDVSSIRNMGFLFYGSSFNGNISSWDVSSVTNMGGMFALSPFNQDISQWDVSSVNNMGIMFSDCKDFNQDLNSWDISKVFTMNGMFERAISFNSDLNSWDVRRLKSMRSIFNGASSFNKSLANWNIDSVRDMSFAFFNATSFDQNLGNWSLKAVSNITSMLSGSALSVQNYDSTLIGWDAKIHPLNLNLLPKRLEYCNATTARQNLIQDGWNLTGDSLNCNSKDDFVSIWKTDELGNSSDSSITIYTDSNYQYNYNVDWDNDGIYDVFRVRGNITYQFPAAGTYAIRISGNFPSIKFGNYGTSNDAEKLITVAQWGNLIWRDLDSAFKDCINLTISARDPLNLDSVNSLSYSFSNIENIYFDINNWDVSNIRKMDGTFSEISRFNRPLGKWNVSLVTDMRSMFQGAAFFNRDISNWDVSSVTNMSSMFREALRFNSNIENWDISSATDLSWMFSSATNFNQNISNWSVDSANNMLGMFADARRFNQDLSVWNFSSTYNLNNFLDNTLYSIENYDKLIRTWDSLKVDSNITVGADKLLYCNEKDARDSLIARGWQFIGDTLNCDPSAFVFTIKTDNPGPSNDSAFQLQFIIQYNYNFDIDWNNDGIYDTLGITTGNIRFQYDSVGTYTIRIRGEIPALSFGINGNNNNPKDRLKIISIEQWGTNSWDYLANAFNGCSNLGYSAYDRPNLTHINDLSSMFKSATAFNGDISTWDVSTIRNFSSMFENASSFNQNINTWDVSSAIDMKSMLHNATSFNQDLSNWDVSNCVDLSDIFNGALSFNKNINSWDVSSLRFGVGMFEGAIVFNQPLNNWNVSSVENFTAMFSGATTFNQNINSWDVSAAVSFEGMFFNANAFNQPLNNWNVSNALNLKNMFRGARSFNQNINSWNTSIVTEMSGTFYDCISFNQPLSNWNTSQLINLSNTFRNAISFNQDINSWNVSRVLTIANIFNGASSFNQALGNWDVGSLVLANGAFTNAKAFNQNINSWDVSNIVTASNLFKGAELFNQPLNQWDVSSISVFTRMFEGAYAFNQNLASWDIGSMFIANGMLDSTSLSIANYDSTLISWNAKPHNRNILFGASELIYCFSKLSRDSLITDGWIINGDSLEASCISVGISEEKTSSSLFSFYPTPSQGVLFIEIEELLDNTPLLIYNQMGQLVREERVQEGRNQIDLSDQSSGIYFIRYGEKTEKVMVQK